MADSNRLEQEAQSFFGTLGQSELKIVRNSTRGETSYCGQSNRDSDPGNNPSDADTWTAERHVRADLIRWLCSSQAAADCISAASGNSVTAPFSLSISKKRSK